MQTGNTVNNQPHTSAPLRNAQDRPLRIGYLHRYNAQSRLTWSGTMFSMGRALAAHVGEVVYLGPDRSPGTTRILENTPRVNRIWKKLTGKPLVEDQNRLFAWQVGRFFQQKLREVPCDVLFAPVASVEIAGLKTNIPIVYYSDITWELILDYYPQYFSLSNFAKAEGERIEATAIRRSAAIVFPSQWAAASAIQHYGASPDRVFQVNFGANLPHLPTREEALAHHLNGQVKLLMVGVDWVRKGGAIAFDCLKSLLARGIDAHLTICGCVPPAGYEHPNLNVIPFLDKNFPEQQQRLSQLYLDSHFLVFPTRADATPIATCEASAHGLPVLVTDTGGVGGAILNGINGYLIPFHAGGDAYADKIVEILQTPDLYSSLVKGARDQYETRLNWDAWGQGMRSVFEYVLASQPPTR